MHKIYNFFFDIDGTLLSRGESTLNQFTVDAFNFARSRGCKIFINTGRTLAYVPDTLKQMSEIDGFVCGCGTYVECDKKTVFEKYLTNDQLYRFAKAFVDRGVDMDILFEGKESNYYYGQGWDWHIERRFIKIDSPDFFLRADKELKLQKFTTHSKLACRQEFFNDVSNEMYTMQFSNYCETVPIGFDKGNGIRITEEILGLDPAFSVAVGDSLNDEGMLRYAATAVAMGNAPDEVKAMCNIVTDTVTNNGAAKIIYKFLS